MTKALIAVGAALALLVGGLGLAVFLTRDKDNIAVDNTLSEDFTRDVTLATPQNPDVDLRKLAPPGWTRALVVAPGTPRETISRRLGYEWNGRQGLEESTAPIVILLDEDGQVDRFFEYRGGGRFGGVRTPIAELPRDRCVFRVTNQVITPR